MEDLFPLRVGMKDQNLYSKSWLGFGTDVAFRGFEEHLSKKKATKKKKVAAKKNAKKKVSKKRGRK